MDKARLEEAAILEVLRVVRHDLEHLHKINHTTVQVEVEGCKANEMYCTVHPAEEHDHAGHHH